MYVSTKNTLKHIDIESGLSDNVVYSVLSDYKNTIWCATDAGITQIYNVAKTPKYEYISNKNGLPDDIVRGIVMESNRLLISMQDSGVCYFNLSNKKVERIPFFQIGHWELFWVQKLSLQKKSLLLLKKMALLLLIMVK